MSFSTLCGSFFNWIKLPHNDLQLNTYRKFFCPKILCFNHTNETETTGKRGGRGERNPLPIRVYPCPSVVKIMNTRTGKIARLPKTIRQELNRLLEDGWTGSKLLEWLNGLPDVQAVLEVEFGGQPISKSNLSHWRAGGYADWLRHQEAHNQLRLMIGESCDLQEQEYDGLICDHISRLAAVELARQTRELTAIEDPEKRWTKFQELSRELSRFQNGAHSARYAQIRWERWQSEQQQKEFSREEKRAYEESLLEFFQSLPTRPPAPKDSKTPELNQVEPG